MYRILSIDHGQVRIGIGISDPLQIISKPYSTIKNSSFEEVFSSLESIISNEKVGKIIVGLPQNTEGKDTIRTEQVRVFVQKLKEKLTIPIEFFNEIYSTLEAREIAKKKGLSIKQTKKIIDSFAASLILETYLKSQK